jgi:hypothetical protein
MCEYCRIHQDDGPFSHQVDHIVAVKHGGQAITENLALSCLECNRHKGTDLTAIDPESDAVSPLFNPRTQTWSEHFAPNGAQIVGRTAIGWATAQLLRLNDPLRIIQRQALIEAGRW